MTKNNDLALEQKPFAELDKALRGLSKLITPLDCSAAQIVKPISEIESKSSIRDDLMDEILGDHPGLTRKECDLMMRSSGF